MRLQLAQCLKREASITGLQLEQANLYRLHAGHVPVGHKTLFERRLFLNANKVLNKHFLLICAQVAPPCVTLLDFYGGSVTAHFLHLRLKVHLARFIEANQLSDLRKGWTFFRLKERIQFLLIGFR